MNGQDAELVLRGGMIYTVDAARSWAQAVAVRGGTIVAVGTDAQIEELTGSGTLVVDLAGRMMLPGFIDAHVHASAAGLERLRCDLSEAHSLADYLAIVRRYAQAAPSGWITGGGWSMDVFPGGIPSRRDLDQVAPDRPVFLSNRDHHAAWVNSKALELAGVTAATQDPADGRIERESDGTPSGTLQEGAMGLVERVIPRPEIDEQVAGISEAQRYLHALGITGWQEAIVGDYAVVPDCFDAYLHADRRGLLTGRVVGALWWQRGLGIGQLDGLVERRERAGGTRRFHATSIKIMQDGVCENFTASMLRPYFDRHGHEANGSGSSFFAAGELKEAVTAIDARGFQVHFHAIGDRAVREALDAVAAARAANGAGDGRHHISHIQVVHPQDLPRFRELGVLANCQPLWACEEPQMTELTLPFLGPERSSWQYPFGSLLRSGAQLCFGSDWPVSSPNPLWELHTAVNRTVPPGYPYAGPGAGNAFLPRERIGLHDAIAAFTIGSAYVNHADDVSGSIEVGKAADFAVLDRNLFAHPVEEIALANVDMTLASGEVVHERAG
ncbi:MAG TPA: amidohydrolase [Streptosporangiaceae bacterium]|nr:amidohydrolase [Streptosporangiaceae bacterium]